jgi:hypothetical protein
LSRWSARFTRFLTELLPGGIGRLAVLLVTPLVLLYLAGGLESREPDTSMGLSWLGWVVGLAVGLVAGAAAYGLLSVALKLVLAGRVKQLRAYRAAREVWRQQLHRRLSEFWQSLTEEQFTDEMASLFARSGFRVAPIRFGSGADLLLERQGRSLIAQCRKRSYQLESEDLYGLQDQLRASGIERGLVVCNKPLGQLEREKAHRHFRRKPIRLIDEARLLYIQEQVAEGRADLAAQAIWR